MDKEKKEINLERKKKFKKEYIEGNARLFQIHWNWKINEDVGQITIHDEVGKMIALWEESYIRIKELEDEWGFKKGQWMVIAVDRRGGIVETYYGVFALGWIDENGIFQGIFFRPEDVLYASELDLPSEQDELEELKELDELDVPDFDLME